jgi:hypothetical protein
MLVYQTENPDSWQPTPWKGSSLSGVITTYATPHFMHIFLVNQPTENKTFAAPEDLWRYDHNTRALEFISEFITLQGASANTFSLVREVQKVANSKLSSYTSNFYPSVMEVSFGKVAKDSDQYCFRVRRKPKNELNASGGTVIPEDDDLFNQGGSLKIETFSFRNMEFIDNRALVTSPLKGTYFDKGTHFHFSVEVPGVQDMKDISLKLIRTALLNQAVITARYPPLLPREDGRAYTANDYLESTYVAKFEDPNNVFQTSADPNSGDALKTGILDKGILTFDLKKKEN